MFANVNIMHLPFAGPPHHDVAITAIEITMATEFLPECKAAEKLEEEGWRDRGERMKKRGLGPLITLHDLWRSGKEHLHHVHFTHRKKRI